MTVSLYIHLSFIFHFKSHVLCSLIKEICWIAAQVITHQRDCTRRAGIIHCTKHGEQFLCHKTRKPHRHITCNGVPGHISAIFISTIFSFYLADIHISFPVLIGCIAAAGICQLHSANRYCGIAELIFNGLFIVCKPIIGICPEAFMINNGNVLGLKLFMRLLCVMIIRAQPFVLMPAVYDAHVRVCIIIIQLPLRIDIELHNVLDVPVKGVGLTIEETSFTFHFKKGIISCIPHYRRDLKVLQRSGPMFKPRICDLPVGNVQVRDATGFHDLFTVTDPASVLERIPLYNSPFMPQRYKIFGIPCKVIERKALSQTYRSRIKERLNPYITHLRPVIHTSP